MVATLASEPGASRAIQTTIHSVSSNVVFMQSCHLIPMWHEWNMNADDAIMTWFALYVNLSDVMSGMHDTYDLCKTSTSKYLSGLACMQANPNLAKITASHCWVLNTQNAN